MPGLAFRGEERSVPDWMGICVAQLKRNGDAVPHQARPLLQRHGSALDHS